MAGQEVKDTGSSHFDAEDDLVLKGKDGRFYIIPSRHLPQNIVSKEHEADLQSRIASQSPDRDSLEFLGIFKLTRTVRRTWARPMIQAFGKGEPVPTS